MSQRRKQILIADDQPAVVGVLRFTLEAAGYGVTAVGDGGSALKALGESRYDLVILDQQMPVMSGVELCRQMRSRRDYQHTPVIMLTGKGLELDSLELEEELGVSLIMAKPFSPVAVADAVREHFVHSAVSQ